MKIFKLRNNLSNIQRICLAGLMIAIVVIFQKVIAVNYISALPFFRLSFGGPALIIFSSILLGPWYGLLIGVGSDLLGMTLDMSGISFLPQITAIYGLLGFSSYFVFEFVRNIRNKKLMIGIECAGFVAFFVAITLFVLNKDSLEMWQKISLIAGAIVLSIGVIVFSFLYDKTFKFELGYNVFQISFCSFILELFVMLIFGSLMKAWAFGFSIYLTIFICQAAVMFFNIAMDTVVISLLIKVSKKYMTYEN